MKIDKMKMGDADILSGYLVEALYGWSDVVAKKYFIGKIGDKNNVCLVVRKGKKVVAGLVAKIEPYWDDKQVLIEMVVAREGEEKAGIDLIREIINKERNKVKYVNLLIDSRMRRLGEKLDEFDWEQPTLVVLGNEISRINR